MSMVLARMGSMRMMIFSSSTCVTVHTFHGSALVFSGSTAALSKNLEMTTHLSSFHCSTETETEQTCIYRTSPKLAGMW